MVCMYCDSKTDVINSRPQKRLNHVWRRRHCPNCGATFSSIERPAYDTVWRVKTPQGNLTPFQQNKLFLSLYKALEHREQAIEDAAALMDTIVSQLRTQTASALLEVNVITQTAYKVLKNFDNAAAVHYHAFHRSAFKS